MVSDPSLGCSQSLPLNTVTVLSSGSFWPSAAGHLDALTVPPVSLSSRYFDLHSGLLSETFSFLANTANSGVEALRGVFSALPMIRQQMGKTDLLGQRFSTYGS